MISYVLYILSSFLILAGILFAYGRPLECGPFTAIFTSLVLIVGGTLSAYYLSWLILVSTLIVVQLVYKFGLRKTEETTEILSSEGSKLFFKNKQIHIRSIVFSMFDVIQEENLDLSKKFKEKLRSVTAEISISDDQIFNKNPSTIAETSDFFQFKTKYHSGILEFHENKNGIVCVGIQLQTKLFLPEVQFNMLSQIFDTVKPHYGDPIEQIPDNEQPNIMKFEDSKTICIVTNDTVKIDGEKRFETIFRIFKKTQISGDKHTTEFLSN